MDNIALVKAKLWRFGYSVKDFREFPKMGYDLLVQKASRLRVMDLKPESIPRNIEVVAVVSNPDIITFMKRSRKGIVCVTSPYPIFGRP